jgi:hypothetical protein
MSARTTGASPRGSEWRRWDPHLHAPGTLLGDQFGNDWDSYLSQIEQAQPAVQALGVTDYFCIRGYRQVREHVRRGRLPGVGLVFPNVEIRLGVQTERQKGINLHLLFAPDDEHHEAQIERILSQLTFEFRGSTFACRTEEFERLGSIVDPTQQDTEAKIRAGANQFKVTLPQLKHLFRSEKWLTRNCLIAVAAAEGDGTGGLQGDPSFLALREELEAFADVIFSGKPSDRAYWLGKKSGFSRDFIEKKYGNLKPCLHGSDAHRTDRVLVPDLERLCWLKADLTFEGLRQAAIEPDQRVFIGKEPPLLPADHERMVAVTVSQADWFSSGTLELTPGLIAIIGARGSGKTALADIIACATGSCYPHGVRAEPPKLHRHLKRSSLPIGQTSKAAVLRRSNLLSTPNGSTTWDAGYSRRRMYGLNMGSSTMARPSNARLRGRAASSF